MYGLTPRFSYVGYKYVLNSDLDKAYLAAETEPNHVRNFPVVLSTETPIYYAYYLA